MAGGPCLGLCLAIPAATRREDEPMTYARRLAVAVTMLLSASALAACAVEDPGPEAETSETAAALVAEGDQDAVEGTDENTESLALPPGSWSQYCPIYEEDGGTVLCARCYRRNGVLTEGFSCIDWAGCGAVNNCDGHLQCSPDC
jgi:hypothetical protein